MKTFWNTYKSSILLLAAMVAGGVIGFFWGPGASVLQPIADTFLNLLYCCVVPLIFCSLTAAIAKMQDLAKLRKILMIFLIGVIVSGVIACLFMVAPCLVIDPAEGSTVSLTQDVADASGSMNVLGMFTVGDFPLLFAMDRLTAAIVNVINIVMKLAPLGLGCYFAILIGSNGSDVIGPLSKAIVMYLFVIVAYYVVSQTVFAYIGGGMEGVRIWWATCVPSTLTALGTCSSAATLPVNLQQAKKIDIPDEIADLVIPLGANLHKDGACVIQIIKVAFLCSVFHMEYATPRNILMSILVAVIASVVMGGIPAGGYVAEIFIISAFGFPTVAIPIMVLIGTITDAPATVVNVTGDTGLVMVITRFVEGKDWIHRKKLAQKAA